MAPARYATTLSLTITTWTKSAAHQGEEKKTVVTPENKSRNQIGTDNAY